MSFALTAGNMLSFDIFYEINYDVTTGCENRIVSPSPLHKIIVEGCNSIVAPCTLTPWYLKKKNIKILYILSTFSWLSETVFIETFIKSLTLSQKKKHNLEGVTIFKRNNDRCNHVTDNLHKQFLIVCWVLYLKIWNILVNCLLLGQKTDAILFQATKRWVESSFLFNTDKFSD